MPALVIVPNQPDRDEESYLTETGGVFVVPHDWKRTSRDLVSVDLGRLPPWQPPLRFVGPTESYENE